MERHLVGQWKYSTTNILFLKQNKNTNQSLLIYSRSNVFKNYACFFGNSVLLFLFLTVFLILKLNSCKSNNNSQVSPFLVAVNKASLATVFYSLILLSRGDVELNLRPKRNSRNAFSICHWNLNSVSAHNHAKMFLLKA